MSRVNAEFKGPKRRCVIIPGREKGGLTMKRDLSSDQAGAGGTERGEGAMGPLGGGRGETRSRWDLTRHCAVRPANYIYRAAGWDLLREVRHLTNRGLMTVSKMDEFQEQALTLTCNMWDSEDFPRYEYRLTPFAETDEFFPLNVFLQDM